MGTPLLPDDFVFSQSSLRDFSECPRRFLLRRVEEQGCPAPEAEPIRVNEERRKRGTRFHEMVCQHHSGVPQGAIARQCAGDDILHAWWEEYVAHDPAGGKRTCYAEISLQGQVAGYRLTAKYDLLAVTPSGKLHIFDWKTSQRRPDRRSLTKRLQTKVYPYLAVEAGSELIEGSAVDPSQVMMTYWFSNHPSSAVTFEYSTPQYKLDEETLTSIVEEARACEERNDFELTGDEANCKYCTYRSYCQRGVEAGAVEEGEGYLEDTGALRETSLEDVEAIAF